MEPQPHGAGASPGVNALYFEYGDVETSHLKKACPAMKKAIERIGHIYRPVVPDLFEALVWNIVGQQISSKALQTVWGRMCDGLAPITPQRVWQAGVERLQAFGISTRKATYIYEAAATVLDGGLDLAALPKLPHDEVARQLCRLKGVGLWTAEMLMIFSMQRKDVLSGGDLAIVRGLRMLHRHREVTPALLEKYRRRYTPYNTVASLYLWAISAGALPELDDPAPAKTKK